MLETHNTRLRIDIVFSDYIRQLAHGDLAEMSPGGDIHGGGSPEMCRLAVWRDTDTKYYEEQVKRIIGICDEEYVPPVDKFGKW